MHFRGGRYIFIISYVLIVGWKISLVLLKNLVLLIKTKFIAIASTGLAKKVQLSSVCFAFVIFRRNAVVDPYLGIDTT